MNIKRFVQDTAEWEAERIIMKRYRCPHCLAPGTLISHGRLYGYQFRNHSNRVLRGFRLFCSNRYRRKGCGRTFSVWLAWKLYRSLLNAMDVWRFICGLLDGQAPQTIARHMMINTSNASAYRLCARLKRAQFGLRTILQGLSSVSAIHRSLPWPWLLPYDHLRQLHPDDAIQWLQYQFQKSFFLPSTGTA